MDERIVDGVRRDVDNLRADVRGWIAPRIGAGELGARHASHRSQLVAVDQWYDAILGYFSSDLSARPERERARKIRGPLFGLLKLWDRVRERLQQHETGGDGRAWRGADDVAYACYEPTLKQARARCRGRRFQRRPPPLPLMSPEWGAQPMMFEAGELPREFVEALSGEALRTFRLSWPLTLVMLPTTYVDSPWWLVMLGHEVGHVIHFELGIQEAFARSVAEAASAAAHPDAARWAGWSSEVFADVYSVLVMGRAALLGLLELVHDDAARMSESAEPRVYPPAVIRLELMQRFAVRVGSMAPDAQLPLKITANSGAARELPFLDAIVSALVEPLPTLGCGLSELCGHGDVLPDNAAPRTVIAEMFLEYAKGAVGPDALRERTLKELAAVARDEPRGGEKRNFRGDSAAQAREIGELLIEGAWGGVRGVG
jgi:hypothetical protein